MPPAPLIRNQWVDDHPQLDKGSEPRMYVRVTNRHPLPQGRVALLGIAYRHISIKFTQKTRKPSQPKPLPASVKSVADWIAVKLHERGMAAYQLGEKMGIASTLVNAWKSGMKRPNAYHIRKMVLILGKYCPASALQTS